MIKLAPPRQNHSSINLTPLVDVVFLLLIFFLLTAVFMSPEGMDINLPNTKTPLASEDGEIKVAVKAPGLIFLEGEEVDLDRLEVRLRNLLARKKSPVVVEADRTVAVQAVVSVMERAERAGASNLILATESQPIEPGDERQ